MGQFIKKAFPVEAVQLTQEMKDGFAELPENVSHGDTTDFDFKMMNKLGLIQANVGDFHVTGFEGETYFITRDIFQKTYLPFKKVDEKSKASSKASRAPKSATKKVSGEVKGGFGGRHL